MKESKTHSKKAGKKKKKKLFQKSLGIKKKSLSLHPLLEGTPWGTEESRKRSLEDLHIRLKDKAEYTRVL